MGLAGKIVGRIVYPAWLRARGGATFTRLGYLTRTEWRSFDELAAIQEGALRTFVRRAYGDPTCRARIDAAGGPDAVRTVEDLARIAPVREATHATADAWARAVELRALRGAGIALGAPTLEVGAVSRGGTIDRALARRARATAANDDEARRIVERMRAAGTAVVLDAQAAERIARVAGAATVARKAPVLAERPSPATLAALRAAFGPDVYATYSFDGAVVAAECGVHDGLHVAIERWVVEVVVPGEARAAREGERGEIVVTDLRGEAPRLRVATGDFAVAGPTSRCACGRGLPRLGAAE